MVALCKMNLNNDNLKDSHWDNCVEAVYIPIEGVVLAMSNGSVICTVFLF